MAYYQNWVQRFVFRKDFFRRAAARIQQYSRRLRKDELDDLAFLLADRPPNVIFDCGANVGFVMHRFRTLFPRATIYAFERNPDVYRVLENTYAEDNRTRTRQLAISKAPGRLTFHQNANSGTSSFFTPTAYNRSHWARRVSHEIEVEVYNLYELNESAIRQAVLGNATFISGRLRRDLAGKWGAERCGW